MSGKSSSVGRYRTATFFVFALVATVAFVATALVFSVASGTSDAADQGKVAVLAESSLGAASATRNATVQAQVLAEARSLNLASKAELQTALDQVEYTSAQLTGRIDLLVATLGVESVDAEIAQLLDELLANVVRVEDLLRAGAIEDSAGILANDVSASYQTLVAGLVTVRDDAMEKLAIAGEDAGRIADGARFLVVVIVPVAVLIAYRRRVRQDQHSRDLEHQLARERAVAHAREKFIQNLSHELRTPLTAIYGFSLELFDEERVSVPEVDRELLSFIVSESAELSRMVEDILVAGAADQDALSINPRDVDPVSEIVSVVEPMRTLGAHVATRLDPATITADPLRFAQVVRNLVSNALRHGGPDNLVSGFVAGDRYVVQVRDNGRGLPEHIKKHLFSPFVHQGDEPLLTGSIGLGLAVAHLVTTRSGGTIEYRRDRGDTVFEVSFPLAESATVDPEPRLNAILR